MAELVMIVITGDRPRGSCSRKDWMEGGSFGKTKQIILSIPDTYFIKKLAHFQWYEHEMG